MEVNDTQPQNNPNYVKIDYENQNLDDFDINPYEMVVAVSGLARDINDKVQKNLGPNASLFPLNIAYKKLESDNVTFAYDEEKKD
jgi:hypothetical protein